MHLNISKYKICEKRATYMSFLTVLISNFHIFIAKLQEQDDVYFECRIVSNPEATKLEWYHEVNFSDKFPSCHIRNYVPLAGAPIVPQCIRRHPPLQSVARYSGNLQVQRLAIIWDGGQNIKTRVTPHWDRVKWWWWPWQGHVGQQMGLVGQIIDRGENINCDVNCDGKTILIVVCRIKTKFL